MTFTINEHIMTLKYNKFKCYWAAVTEKNNQMCL